MPRKGNGSGNQSVLVQNVYDFQGQIHIQCIKLMLTIVKYLLQYICNMREVNDKIS